MVIEQSGINIRNEKSLHRQLKEWYAAPGDRFEVKMDNFIIDILRGDMFIEIQTGNFSSIRNKIRKLAPYHSVRVVYPIPSIKHITLLDADGGGIISSRKSPKKGIVEDLFAQLLTMPDIVLNSGFSLEVLMVKVEEIRLNDGKGSWRRRGNRILDRQLTEVERSVRFNGVADYAKLLPENLPDEFTNKDLAACSGMSCARSGRMTYCLKKMGAIGEIGRIQNQLVFKRV